MYALRISCHIKSALAKKGHWRCRKVRSTVRCTEYNWRACISTCRESVLRHPRPSAKSALKGGYLDEVGAYSPGVWEEGRPCSATTVSIPPTRTTLAIHPYFLVLVLDVLSRRASIPFSMDRFRPGQLVDSIPSSFRQWDRLGIPRDAYPCDGSLLQPIHSMGSRRGDRGTGATREEAELPMVITYLHSLPV